MSAFFATKLPSPTRNIDHSDHFLRHISPTRNIHASYFVLPTIFFGLILRDILTALLNASPRDPPPSRASYFACAKLPRHFSFIIKRGLPTGMPARRKVSRHKQRLYAIYIRPNAPMYHAAFPNSKVRCVGRLVSNLVSRGNPTSVPFRRKADSHLYRVILLSSPLGVLLRLSVFDARPLPRSREIGRSVQGKRREEGSFAGRRLPIFIARYLPQSWEAADMLQFM